MTAYEVMFQFSARKRFIVDASSEDEADEKAYEELKYELGQRPDIRDVQIKVVTKDEVEG